ncbi:MAG: hypothetical protein K2O14_04380, partial [Oscillospiraceae bacterium]|nr:hypothetical protein [Oscillospiraceae bacterium]
MSITLNENGMIADDDKLYEKLDKWHDGEDYDKIVSAVLDIPQENRSNKLWFRLISAYNNLKQFDKADEELRKIFPRCEAPVDRARWHYMNGYIFDINRRELAAMHCYEDALEADPDDTAGLDLEKNIEDCRRYIEKDLKNLRELSEKITKDIKKRYAQMPWSEKYELNDEEFTLQLGFLPAIRKIPGHEHGPGFKEYFIKYKGEQKEQAKEWLERLYGITARKSFIEFFQTSRDCNIAHFANDVIAHLNGEL